MKGGNSETTIKQQSQDNDATKETTHIAGRSQLLYVAITQSVVVENLPKLTLRHSPPEQFCLIASTREVETSLIRIEGAEKRA